jgi:CDGSH-type Zn-finger protein/ferredoxin
MSERPTIECKPNGPYLVRGIEDFKNSQGDRFDGKPVMALCRCGGSGNKPFCDGTHQKNGFSDAKATDRVPDRRESYQAGSVAIHDNRSICAHAGHCTNGLGSVFKYKSEPWIDPAAATVESIVEAVNACPSGALSCSVDGAPIGAPEREASITVTKDGPYAVVGSAQLLGQSWAEGASAEHYTLCRCGGSKNKPFCDGTHWSMGFKG